jgi:hypothetical protein
MHHRSLSSVRVPRNSGSFPVKRLSDAQLKQEKINRQMNLQLIELNSSIFLKTTMYQSIRKEIYKYRV